MSENEVQTTGVDDNLKMTSMMIRLNELQNVLEGFETFKERSIGMLPVEM